MKKLGILLLAVTLAVTPITFTYAQVGAKGRPVEEEMRDKRYYFKTVTGRQEDLGSVYISQSDFDRANTIWQFADILLAKATWSSAISDIYSLAESIYGINSPGRMHSYRTVIKTYKVDRLTGNKRLYSTKWKILIKYYKDSGGVVTRTHTLNLK